MEFKDRLKELRLEKGLTQTALASHFGKSESAVRMWESERSRPDIDTLIELAKYFDCTTDYLLGISEFKNQGEKDELEHLVIKQKKILERLYSLEKITSANDTPLIVFLEKLLSEKYFVDMLLGVSNYIQLDADSASRAKFLTISGDDRKEMPLEHVLKHSMFMVTIYMEKMCENIREHFWQGR